MLDLTPATAELIRLLDAVQDDQLADPTPCPDYPVAALLDHLMGLSMAFTWAATKTYPELDGPPPTPGTSTPEQLDPQWRTLLPERLRGLAAAWSQASAWEGTAEAGGVTMPAQEMGIVALDEVVLHGWDLASATGQEFRCDPASTQAVLGFTAAVAGQDQAGNGIFGAPVAVPGHAPALHRALGFAGRNPAWHRAGSAAQ